MHVVLGVTESDASLRALNWVKNNPLCLWKDLNLTIVHVMKHAGSGVSLLRQYESMAKEFAKTVSTRLLSRQKSVGQTLKEFVASLENPLLVIGSTGHKWKVIDYLVQRCECPVMVVKRSHTSPSRGRPTVALATDVNVHCDRTFSWFLKQADLPDVSQLYVVHITPKKSDKPDARRFLAALKPKCLESKRMYSMASALVSYDKGGIADGIVKFSHDKNVETLIIASKGDRQLSRLRLSSSIIEDCLRNSSLDVMVWMDEQTRNVSASPYIWNGPTGTAPIKLATWENSKATKNEKNTKIDASTIEDSKSRKVSAHPPSYPRPLESGKPHEDAPLAPIQDSYATPISDLGKRRKSSLKYYMYGQIAKGKNSLNKITDTDSTSGYGEFVEPLSP
jgi:nucleotide-binding universal stress UspA family protein